MSRLDELIQKFCPNGVEFVKIKEVFPRLKGTPITAGKMKEIENSAGEIKIFAGGKTVISAKEIDIPKTNIIRVPAVLVQSRGVIDVIYYDKPFTFKNEMWAYTADNPSKVKYLYYILKNNIQAFRAAASGMGSLPQISLSVTEDLHIPLPPLPIQQEIVRILDTFTNLTAELTAELTARRKQYEYYRDELLTFGEDVSRVQLGLVCDFKYGKGNNIPNETGEYPVYGCNGIVSTTNTFNSEDAPIIGHIGSAGVVNWGKGKHFVTYNGTICRVKADKIRSRYAYYVLNSLHLERFVKGSQPFLSYGDFSKVLIPLPPIERQDEIVRILDQFDYFCNDLTSGIPAEISARQKQYEYYRNQLLTFKRIGG